MPRRFDRERVHFERHADVSEPPQQEGTRFNPPAQPYNPGAYEEALQGGHGVTNEIYQWAIQQGSTPQQAYEQAQQQQQQLAERAQTGQSVQNMFQLQSASDNPLVSILRGYGNGFVSTATVKRVSHLL